MVQVYSEITERELGRKCIGQRHSIINNLMGLQVHGPTQNTPFHGAARPVVGRIRSSKPQDWFGASTSVQCHECTRVQTRGVRSYSSLGFAVHRQGYLLHSVFSSTSVQKACFHSSSYLIIHLASTGCLRDARFSLLIFDFDSWIRTPYKGSAVLMLAPPAM